ncbi:MAG: hypothetical protein K6T28_10185 [Acidothermus sp.]|nr:hypothetical protein [Acidothermus sp.]
MTAYDPPVGRRWKITETLVLPAKLSIALYESRPRHGDDWDEIIYLIDELESAKPPFPRTWPDHERSGPLPDHWQAKVDHALHRPGDDDGGGQ